jgi:glucose/arabinose dehydrogenase
LTLKAGTLAEVQQTTHRSQSRTAGSPDERLTFMTRRQVPSRRFAICTSALVVAMFTTQTARAQTDSTTTAATTAPTTTAPTTTAPTAAPTTEPSGPLKGLKFEVVGKGLSEPVDVAAPLNDGLIFVVQRAGMVRTVDNGRLAKEPFANLKSVLKSSSIEQGLLGIAFHPNYPSDRRVFFFHSLRNNDNVLVSYLVGPDGRQIVPGSRVELLTVDKAPDAVRHNGGALRFGPDTFLYVSLGDAARAKVHGQDPKTLPGSILRIDINKNGGAKPPYAIPPDNPFADGVNGRPEVWWYGLRNPWRFTIDAKSGLAYIGDVGQETIEEVNVVPVASGGLNFGWPLLQGTKRFYAGTPKTPTVAPVLEVFHNDTDGGCSITGGEVYRGTAIPELDGHYFYADWCLGWIRSFRYDAATATGAATVTAKKDWSTQLPAAMVSAFGRDAAGELLVLDYDGGTVLRVQPVR